MNLEKLIVASCAVLSMCAVHAETYTWNGTEGDFSSPTIWEGDHETGPGVADEVVIERPESAAAIITVSEPIKIASLSVGGGEGERTGTVTLNFTSGLVTNEVTGDVSVLAGATLTHEALASTIGTLDAVNRWLNLSVGGDMTVAEGAAISADACGFAGGKGPYPSQGSGNSMVCASHGGCGGGNGSGYPRGCYGSIRNPSSPGSGGRSSAGGGIIHLSVVGELSLVGAITANAADNGAGGSVRVSAASFIGSGTISARGGSSAYGGGGGRIAVYARDAESWEGFPCTLQVGNIYNGGSGGTVYRECAVDELGEGELIIDKVGTSQLSTQVEDASEVFGKVSVSGNATLSVTAGVTLRIRRTLYTATGTKAGKNYAVCSVGGAGALEFVPQSGETCAINMMGKDSDAGYVASVSFASVSCTSPGATLAFSYLAKISVSDGGGLVLKGGQGNLLRLKASTDGKPWYLNLGADALADVAFVNVSDSNASSGASIAASDSEGEDANNVNWVFVHGARPGDPLVWTGAEDSSWLNALNWLDQHGGTRAPLDTDVITIPAGCPHDPVLAADTLVNVLTNNATITLNGGDLIVTNDFACGGTIARSDLERLVLAGDGDVTADLRNGSYREIVIAKTGGSVAFAHGFTAETLRADVSSATTFAFAAGETVKVGTFDLNGLSGESHLLTLVSSAPGSRWLLNVTGVPHVRGVVVSDSDASAGRRIAVGSLGTDVQGNVNWDFADGSVAEWTGAVDSDWMTPGNWRPVGVPGASAQVAICPEAGETVSVTVTNDAPVPVGGLVLGGMGGSVTLRAVAPLAVGGAVEVADGATLVLDSPDDANTVAGDMTIRHGGTVTHTGPQASSTVLYRVNLSVGGDLLIESGGAIDVTGRGFARGYGPGRGSGSGSSQVGPSHGGLDERAALGTCYGSVFRPLALGSPESGTLSGGGGGSVLVSVAGDLTVNGRIESNGSGGSGGSIVLEAAVLRGTGTGSIAANGVRGSSYAAGGGRIALYETEATDWSAWKGSVSAVSSETNTDKAGNGTVYRQTASDKARGGVITVVGAGVGATELPMAEDGVARTAYAQTTLCVSNGVVSLLSNMKVKDLDLASTTARINLNGHVLKVSSHDHKDGKGWGDTYEKLVTEGGGKIIWSTGLAVLVR